MSKKDDEAEAKAKVASDQELLMAVANAVRHISPAVKAMLQQREQADAEKNERSHSSR